VADVPDGRRRPDVRPARLLHIFAGKDFEDKRPRDRYTAESKRLLGVLNQRLKGRRWIMGDDYTIADIAIWPWVRNLVGYKVGDLVGFADFPKCSACSPPSSPGPPWRKGLTIPPAPN
jgi:GSH-dependent disulfide-bond oxidoreductase